METKKRSILMLSTLVMVVSGVGQTDLHAGFVTTTAATSPTSTTVDFSQFSGDFQFTTGPVQVGGLVAENITWQSNSSGSVIGNGGYGLGNNGFWDSGRLGYVGTNAGATGVIMTFRFNSGSVSEVGGFVNYAPGFGPAFTITALAADNSVLETYNVNALAPISTPGQQNAGDFRGIVRTQNDIAAFQLSGSFDVLDDLRFSRQSVAAVPEPASMAMLGIGALGLMGYGWRKRKQNAAIKTVA